MKKQTIFQLLYSLFNVGKRGGEVCYEGTGEVSGGRGSQPPKSYVRMSADIASVSCFMNGVHLDKRLTGDLYHLVY